MIKFVKGSLIAAGGFAVIGIVLCLISMIFGGRNLSYMIKNDAYLDGKLERVGEKLENVMEKAEGWNISWGHRHHESSERLIVNDVDQETTGVEEHVSIDGIRNLNLILGAGSLVVREKNSSDGIIDIYVQGRGGCDYRTKDDTFYIEGFKGINTIGSNMDENVITLVFPSGSVFEEVDMEVGAGVMEISHLRTREMDAVIGAGGLYLQQAETGDLAVEVGAGKVEADDMVSGDISLTVSMGECIYEGTASGDIDVECDMGSVGLTLKERERDFNYEIECGMGSVQIGGTGFTGLGSQKRVDNGVGREIDVECSMGNIMVSFEE